MTLKKYSRPLDLLLASVATYRQGKVAIASKLFVKACESSGIDQVLAALDDANGKAQEVAKADTLTKHIEKAKAKVVAEGEDDLDLEELNLEEGDDMSDGGDEIDDLLDGLDDSETSEAEDDKKDDEEKSAEGEDDKKDDEEKSADEDGKDDEEKSDSLHQEQPKADKNEPAKTVAKAKVTDKRAAATAHNLKALARLAKK